MKPEFPSSRQENMVWESIKEINKENEIKIKCRHIIADSK
jgi:hypothetical protein